MGEQRYSFDGFTLDLARACLLRQNREVRLRPKSYEAFKYLVENRGRLVTKQELISVLWPESFVTDDSLVKCLRDVRLALGDEGHRYIKTVPRRGYIFDAEVVDRIAAGESRSGIGAVGGDGSTPDAAGRTVAQERPRGGRGWDISGSRWLLGAAALAVALTGATYLSSPNAPKAGAVLPLKKELVRLTFDPGLQSEPTWSPDGRLVAYSADHGGNSDIWVKPLSDGNAVQLTTSAARDWQPDWSPDGSRIAFRSERDGGGIYVMAALGGRERKISAFGYRPRWSPDGSQVLFTGSDLRNVIVAPQLYVATLDGRSPREILADTVADFRSIRAAWHPDGRISLWGEHRLHGQSFWTIGLGGHAATRSDVADTVATQLAGDAAPHLSNFFWASSGDSLYFEGLSRGVTNLWKVRVDPQTLRWIAGPERLTIGPGPDLDAALSRDGTRLAYTTRRETVRFWQFPFESQPAVALGEGRPLTSEELNVIDGELSPDGRRLAFGAERAGRSELWEKSLQDGAEKLLAADTFARSFPRWSRDSRRLTYLRSGRRAEDENTLEHSMVLRPAGGGEEQVLTSPHAFIELPSDWSADGQWVLASTNRGSTGRHQVCWFPVSAAPRAEIAMRVLVSDPGHDVWHARLSPDSRWVSFHAVDVKRRVSNVYVRPTGGGRWTPVTLTDSWAGKARWSADGTALYFISNRSGAFEIWGVRFDPVEGKPLDAPFQVLQLDGNRWGRSLAGSPPPGLSFAAGRLVLPLKEISGSLWLLESLER